VAQQVHILDSPPKVLDSQPNHRPAREQAVHFILNLQKVSLCFLQRDNENIYFTGSIWSYQKPESNKKFWSPVKKKDSGVKGIKLSSDRKGNGFYHLVVV
jgi:hypothetical protein